MRDARQSTTRPTNHHRLTVAAGAVVGAILLAACGSAGHTASGHTATGLTATRRVEKAKTRKGGAVDFAACMRAHGVPNFPDPQTRGGAVQLIPSGSSAGINRESPAFQAAQHVCVRLLPGGAPTSEAASPEAHLQMLAISKCMRQHGISDFPDPTRGAPPSGSGQNSAVIGHGGYVLAIPQSVDVGSPGFKQAAVTCHFAQPGAAGNTR